MKPLVLNISIPASALAVAATSAEELAEEPLPDIPELRVLNHYVGQWEDEISGKSAMKRTETAEWVLNGRFVRQTWSAEGGDGAPKASGITLMTFDLERKVYRSWAFLATGSVIENEGVWDAVADTLTWSHQVAQTSETVVTKSSFMNGETQTWSIVKIDAKGKVIREVTGRSHRASALALRAA